MTKLSLAVVACIQGQQGTRLRLLTKGFSPSVSAGIGSQKGVLRSLVRQALAVKDANPRISTHAADHPAAPPPSDGVTGRSLSRHNGRGAS
jgi:hypothetical protein